MKLVLKISKMPWIRPGLPYNKYNIGLQVWIYSIFTLRRSPEVDNEKRGTEEFQLLHDWVGVAPPLYVTRKILYGILVHQRYSAFTVQSIWRRRVISWHSGLFRWWRMISWPIKACNDRKWSQVELLDWCHLLFHWSGPAFYWMWGL